jgi:alpha-galactosidase/6-phospho-beta-glucosidase family protein
MVEAALEGSFGKALAVLAGDPMVGDPRIARPMLIELIAANEQWLPQFDTPA